jgi:hypothetical protein
MQRFLFRSKAHGSALVALGDQIVQERFIGTSIDKIAAASHAQGLIDGLFEAGMGLFDIAILMRNARIVPGRLHIVMGHQGLVAFCPVLALTLVQLTDSSRQMIGAMLLRDTSYLPEATLQTFG